MPIIDDIDYDSTFGGVIFQCGRAQGLAFEAQFADTTIVGGAVTGTSYTYRDWYASPPDVLDVEILVPDRATLDDLAALRGYPVDNAGVAYELYTPQVSWSATLDKLTTSQAWMDVPIVAKAVFTKVADLVAPAAAVTTAPTAGFVWGVSGLTASLDLNQDTESPDGEIDSYSVEWGDAATTSESTGAPWEIAAIEIPVATHTYAAPGTYVVTVSVVRSGETSADYSALVTVP